MDYLSPVKDVVYYLRKYNMSIKADMNWLMGCLFDEVERDRITALQPFPAFGAAASQFGIENSGKGTRVELWKSVDKLNGSFNTRTQGDSDCVANGTATAIDNVKGVEIDIKEELEIWTGETCCEDIYAGSRNQVGQGRLRGQGGSYGHWAASYVTEYGTLVRGKYGNYDLTAYNVNTVRNWADKGVPAELLNISREHKIKTISRINNYSEAISSLSNGYSLTMCSNQGFTTYRNKKGVCSPKGVWPHCLAVLGFDDTEGESLLCICNSWGNYLTGPSRHGEPNCMFYIEAEVFDRICNSSGAEVWAFSDYNGFPPKTLPLRLF